MSHTTDDDDRRYRPADEVDQAKQRDPIITLGNLLLEQGILAQEQIDEAAESALAAVDAATDAADIASPPDVSLPCTKWSIQVDEPGSLVCQSSRSRRTNHRDGPTPFSEFAGRFPGIRSLILWPLKA